MRKILLLFFIFIIGCGQNHIANLDSKGKTIVCFGNSITEGIGAGKGEDFPSLLSEKVRLPVINAGVSGDTTRDALKRMEKDVLAQNPKLVIVEFGGNDYLRQLPRKETLDNMDKIVSKIHKEGIIVAIAVIKIGIISDRYLNGFKNIARKYGAIIIPNIMKGILDNPALKYDSLHPNPEGYKIISDRIYQGLKPIWEKI